MLPHVHFDVFKTACPLGIICDCVNDYVTWSWGKYSFEINAPKAC